MRKGLGVIFLVSALSTSRSSAQTPLDADYRCRVERMHTSSSEASPEFLRERKFYIGKEFTVDRRTGIMAGVLKNSYVNAPVVVDEGSTENSFKVVTLMRAGQGAGRGSLVQVLVVKEWDELEKKPFVFLSDDRVYVGNCQHF